MSETTTIPGTQVRVGDTVSRVCDGVTHAGTVDAEQLAAIRARVEAATAGPWTWASRTTVDTDAWEVFDPQDRPLASNHDGWSPDATFIAHARTDIPALLAEIERLRARVGSVAAERDARNAALTAQVERVRALHIDDAHGDCDHDGCEALCRACLDPWPCATVRALDA